MARSRANGGLLGPYQLPGSGIGTFTAGEAAVYNESGLWPGSQTTAEYVSLADVPAGPAITTITVTDIGFNDLDDIAVNSSNAYIKITGTGFAATSNVYVAGTQVPTANVTYTSATELRVALPTLTVGSNSVVSVFNSTGSGAIYAGNLLCSGFPTITTSLYSSASLTVSTQLLATGDGTLTYTLQDGSSLPAGLTLNSNGLITGTASGDSVSSFTVLVNDPQNQSTQQAITLTISSGDPYYKYATFLLQADDTNNNSVNSILVDSTGNSAITYQGTVTQGTNNPFGTRWSNYFDGTGDYLNNTTSTSTSGNFTLEAWVYRIAAVTSVIIGLGSEAVGRTYMYVNSAGTLNWGVYGVGDWDLGGSVPLHSWNHIAVCRVGTTVTGYVNGTALATTTTSNQTVGNSGGYGVGGGQNGSNLFYGYISDARIVIGTAVYTASFTPNTTPLTAIANTVLLTCQSNYFKDNSTNAYTLTVNGNPKVERFNPFGLETSYNVSANTFNTGSTFFASAYLQVPSSSEFAFGTGDFTVEGWVYSAAATNGNFGFFDLGTANSSGSLALFHNSSSFYIRIDGASNDLTVAVPVDFPNAWHHIALVRSSGTLTFYIDGVSKVSGTRTQNITQNTPVVASVNPAYGIKLDGYLSNFRMIKGTALYTTAFTPPTTPLTAITNTKLLTCQSTQSVLHEASANNFVLTYSGTTVTASSKTPFSMTDVVDTSTANVTYSGSYYFNSGDYLSVPYVSAKHFWYTDDFTLEAWVYPAALSTWSYNDGTNQRPVMIGNMNPTTDSNYWSFGPISDGRVGFYYYSGSPNWSFSTATIQANSWSHIAVTKTSAGIRLWVNGVPTSVITISGSPQDGASNNLVVGSSGASTGRITGYISNLRILRGTALYTTAFTPPTAPVPVISNTTILFSGKNSGMYDATLQNNIWTSGDTNVKTSTYKYGTGSMYFDGTTDYAIVPTTTNFGYGTGNFTIEFWMNLGTVGADQTVISNLTSASSVNPHIYFSNSDDSLKYYTNSTVAITSGALSVSTWYHVAVCRSSGSTKMFINGTQVGSTYTDGNNYGTTAPLGIGTYWSAGAAVTSSTFNGYLDDIRITKGYARYTANFSAPDAAFKNK